jgi:hypothetical protein
MGRRLRTVAAWLSRGNEAGAEIVFLLNGAVSVIAGIASGLWLASLRAAIAIVVAAFVLLTAALFDRRFSMVGAVAGSLLCGLWIGLFASSFLGLGVLAGIGGTLIGCGAFVGTFQLYKGFVRSTTGAGDLEGRYAGTFNERDERMKKGSGGASVLVSAVTEGGDHDLRITGLVVGGVAVELHGVRREGTAIAAELRQAAATPAPFELLRGKAMVDGAKLIVDLEGVPFGSYVFIGQRERR